MSASRVYAQGEPILSAIESLSEKINRLPSVERNLIADDLQSIRTLARRLIYSQSRVPVEAEAIEANLDLDDCENAELMAWLANDSPNLVMQVDLEGTVRFCNRAGTAAAGIRAGEKLPEAARTWFEDAVRTDSMTSREIELAGRFYIMKAVPDLLEGAVNLYGMDVTEHRQRDTLNQTLIEINHLMHATRDFDGMMKRVIAAAAKALGSETAALSLREDGHFRIAATYGFADDLTGLVMEDAEEKHAVLAIQTKKPVAVDDAFNDARFNRDHLRKYHIRSVLVMPLLVHNRAVGVLFFNHHQRTAAFKQIHIDFAAKLSESVALALENASLTQALEQEIDKRKQINEILVQSEERFSKAFQSSPVPLAITRASDGMYIEVNDCHCDEIGYPRSEIIGKTVLDLGIYFDAEKRSELMRRLREKGSVRNYEMPVRKKSGEVVHGLFSLEPITLNGEACILTMGLDISERKKSEEALEKALAEVVNEKNRLEAVMEALPIGLAFCDAAGKVVQANAEYDNIWGKPRPAASSVNEYGAYRAWWVDTGIQLRPEEWAAARAVIDGETVTGQFLQIQQADGRRRFVINNGAPIRNSEGQISGSAVAIMDISELIEVENALRQTQERFRVALASVPLLVYNCDRDLRYTWVYNPLNGFSGEDLLGKRDDEIIGAEAAAELIAVKQAAVDSGRGGASEITVATPERTSYYILTIEPNKDLKGTVTGLTCSAIDITEQRLLEIQQRERSMQMEVHRRLMEHREQERQGIARELHDGPIQTLSSSAFNIQFIKEDYPDPALHASLDQVSATIKNVVRELRNIMYDLRPPTLSRFGLTRAVEVLVEELRDRHPQIRFETDLLNGEKQLDKQVSLTLFRICQEALNNAVRHSGADFISLVFKMEETGGFFLQVRDNGHGFHPSWELTEKPQDSHYGLVGMQERAASINGVFQVESAPGQGTTITVRGPLLSSLL